MCSHGYFYRGNEKQTPYDFEEHKFCIITNVTFIKSTEYVSYIVPNSEPRFFSGERRRLFEGGAYSKFLALGGALS